MASSSAQPDLLRSLSLAQPLSGSAALSSVPAVLGRRACNFGGLLQMEYGQMEYGQMESGSGAARALSQAAGSLCPSRELLPARARDYSPAASNCRGAARTPVSGPAESTASVGEQAVLKQAAAERVQTIALVVAFYPFNH